MAGEANIAVVQDVYAKFGQGDVPGILALLDPQVRWEYVGRPSDYPVLGPRQGLDGALAFFKAVGENEEITEFTVGEIHASGDKVFVLGHAAYVIKRTGAPAASDWVHVFTFQGGKVTGFKGFIDTAQLAAGYKA